MAIMNRAALVRQMTPGIKALAGLEYKNYPEDHKAVFEVDTSTRAFEEDAMLSGFARAQVKAEGASVSYDDGGESWAARYDIQTMATGFTVTEEAVEDNIYGNLIKRYTKALVRAFAVAKQVKAASILNNAFNSSFAGGDGVELCATTHPLYGGGTFSNEPATAADLNETSLEAALIAISGFTDERGELIAAKGAKLIVPSQLEFVAERLLMSNLRVDSANNDLNAIKSSGALPGGHAVMRWLSDPDAWYVTTDVPDGLKMYERVKLDIQTEQAFDNGVMKVKGRERYAFGWTDPRGIYGSPGA